MSEEKRKESPIIKLYVIILFFLGIGLWLSVNSGHKETISVDAELNRSVINVLTANGVTQEDIIKEYQREKSVSGFTWIEFSKIIKLRDEINRQTLENGLRSAARSVKVGLKKIENSSDGSVTYTFFDGNRNYNNITFVKAI